MSVEVLGADLLREVKEEGLNEVCQNIFKLLSKQRLPYIFHSYADQLSSFCAHYESSKHSPMPHWASFLSTNFSVPSKTHPSRGSSNSIARYGPRSFKKHTKLYLRQERSRR